ncbi:MAG: acetyltransferase [Chlamydiae bacterium CG10_big_fil_rev_8_21_14_0_10_42_34]|nr:MAG: acetyltransferase [Chlamydiae bacterium CG10_big_fil_rev_8_21_14_0_10_42_34]
MKNNRIVIFGCGGHSRSVTDVLLSTQNKLLITYVDKEAKEGETLFGFPVLKSLEFADLPFFFAIGDNIQRKEMYEQMGSDHLISIQSSKTHLEKDAKIGKGVFIGNFTHIGTQTKIGNNTILSSGSNVEQGCVIGNHSHIGPGAVVSSRSALGDQVFIGAGATVEDSISICSNVIIGAGALITRDIEQPGVYIGRPAIPMQKIQTS